MRNGTSVRYWLSFGKFWMITFKMVAARAVRLKCKRKRKKPTVVQLPITHLCNFDCVMCGMHHMINRKDFSAGQLGQIMRDPLFENITSIGINGGEPFLKEDLVECFEQLIDKCHGIREFNIITNGFFTDRITTKLKVLKPLCEKRNILLNLSISVDGINDMQDFHRGRKNAFVNAVETIREIQKDKKSYVDDLQCICTITKYNIERINEVEAWSKSNSISVSYNLATVNVRIENEDRLTDFSVFSDEHARMLTEEFFYSKFLETREEKYFGLYLYVKKGKRYAPCPCQYNEWVTLTPDGNIGYCATHSKNLGCAFEQSAFEIFNNHRDYLRELIGHNCGGCSHYLYSLNAKGLMLLREDESKRLYVRGRIK